MNVKSFSQEKTIFVFGSNLSGIHGAGAAKTATIHHGAIFGQGFGRQGNAYAIPTVAENLSGVLPLKAVAYYVRQFIRYARQMEQKDSSLKFKVTRIGCGLAGFSDDEIAPLFKPAPNNCQFDEKWREFLGEEKVYWGSY